MVRNKMSTVSSSSQNIKKKRNLIQDANAPKRPSSAYIIYTNKCYKDFVLNHPEIDKNQIMSALAEKWKNMSEEEKKPYTDAAQAKKEEYEKRLEEYKKTEDYKNFIENKKQIQIKAKLNKKHNKLADDGLKPMVSTKDGEISIFSSGFIEYNKNRQLYLQKVRREISSLDDEESLIRKNIERLQSKYNDLYVSNRADDNSTKINEKTLNQWRDMVINALESAKLLNSLYLTRSSSIDDIIKTLEEVSKKPNDLLRTCLNSINFG